MRQGTFIDLLAGHQPSNTAAEMGRPANVFQAASRPRLHTMRERVLSKPLSGQARSSSPTARVQVRVRPLRPAAGRQAPRPRVPSRFQLINLSWVQSPEPQRQDRRPYKKGNGI